jgi:hypothetical protein
LVNVSALHSIEEDHLDRGRVMKIVAKVQEWMQAVAGATARSH